MQEPPMPPTFQRQIDDLIEIVGRAFSEPASQTLVDRLTDSAKSVLSHEDDDEAAEPCLREFNSLLSEWLQYIADHHPVVFQSLGERALRDILHGMLFPDSVHELRVRTLPGYPEQPLWVLLAESDVESLRAKLSTGQLWLNVTDLTIEQHRELWGLISYQQQLVLGKQPDRGGRPTGSKSAARARVIEQMRQAPSLPDVEIYQLGLRAGLWKDDGSYYDHPERNKSRVIRLRQAADVRKHGKKKRSINRRDG